MFKSIIILIICILLLPIAFATQTGEDDKYLVSYIARPGTTTSFGNMNVSVVIGEQGIGNFTTNIHDSKQGILYLLSEHLVYTHTPAAILKSFRLIIEDWGIEWILLNWT